MNLLIMGGPGAGKGTMSEKILKKYNILHISTGDIFRSEIAQQTELGLLAKSYMDKGLLVPDDVTNKMVKSFLEKSDHANGYLLDGYPRTIDQAKAFNALVCRTDLEIDRVLYLQIPFDVLAERVTGRRICSNCKSIFHIKNKPPKVEGVCDECGGALYQRKDDTLESLTVRVDEYKKLTAPVLFYYSEKNLVRTINANQSIDDVWNDVQKALED
ncbi:MAG: adenylate kinase [Traorella sp.]